MKTAPSPHTEMKKVQLVAAIQALSRVAHLTPQDFIQNNDDQHLYVHIKECRDRGRIPDDSIFDAVYVLVLDRLNAEVKTYPIMESLLRIISDGAVDDGASSSVFRIAASLLDITERDCKRFAAHLCGKYLCYRFSFTGNIIVSFMEIYPFDETKKMIRFNAEYRTEGSKVETEGFIIPRNGVLFLSGIVVARINPHLHWVVVKEPPKKYTFLHGISLDIRGGLPFASRIYCERLSDGQQDDYASMLSIHSEDDLMSLIGEQRMKIIKNFIGDDRIREVVKVLGQETIEQIRELVGDQNMRYIRELVGNDRICIDK